MNYGDVRVRMQYAQTSTYTKSKKIHTESLTMKVITHLNDKSICHLKTSSS